MAALRTGGSQPLEPPARQPCLAGSPRVPHPLPWASPRDMCAGGHVCHLFFKHLWFKPTSPQVSPGVSWRRISNPNRCYIKGGGMYQREHEGDSLHGRRENTSQATSGFLQQFKWLSGWETNLSPCRGARHCACRASPSPKPGGCRKAGRQKCPRSGVTGAWFLNSLALSNADSPLCVLGHQLCTASRTPST